METIVQQSLEVIKSEIRLEISKDRYEQFLQEAENIIFTRDNTLNVTALQSLRKILTKIDEVHKKGKEKAWEVCKNWDRAKNEIRKPIEDVLNRKTAEYTKIANEIAADKRNQDIENNRIAIVKQRIESAVLDFAHKISGCKTPEDLVNVERLINFEKNGAQAKSKYAEFLPELIDRLAILNDAVKAQKEIVNQYVSVGKEIAGVGDDEYKKLELEEKREQIENTIAENKINVQESAISASLQTEVIPVAQTIHQEVKPRRSVWRWRVDDIKATAKKMPDWVTLEIDENKVDDYLKAKKAEGIPTGQEEFSVAGITFFLDKMY